MAMKVEQASSAEPRRVQTTLNSSAGASTSSSKVSMFGVKSGFVIPKNKLSGSLVPIFRGAKKVESHDAGKEENNKQVQRKTKWGTDLTQDASVRRARALAYQTRVEQITQQLKAGALGTGEDLGSQSPSEAPEKDSSGHQVEDQSQKLEALELEKREAIGEILKLNPSYKAPPDYKPLLKEAKVPIPLKLYPGFNFIGLLLGTGSNTQKRLEEETGAKIRVQGTKAGEAEKGEITLSDGNEDQSAYEELYVHISADTFEKVDAAVALIELLVTPVSGNSVAVSTAPAPVSGDSMIVPDQSQGITTSYAMPAPLINSRAVQPMMGSTQAGIPQTQFQPYPAPWLGPPHPMHPPSSFGLPSNFSAPMPNNANQFPPSSLNASRMPPHLVGHPPFAAGFGLIPRNLSLVAPRPQPPLQSLQQRQYFPEAQAPNPHLRSHPNPGQQPPMAYPTLPTQRNPSVPPQVTGNQPRSLGQYPVATQPFSMSQEMSTASSGPPTNRAFASTGWPAAPVATSAPNMTQAASPMVPSQRPPVLPQHVVTGMSGTGSMVSPASFSPRPFTPQQPNALVNRPATGPSLSSVPPQVGSAPTSAPLPLSSAVPSVGSGVLQAPLASASLSVFPRAGAPPAPASSPAPNQSPVVTPRPVGPQGSAPTISVVGSAPVPPPVPLASPRPQPGISNPMSVSIPSFTPLKPPMSNPQSISPVTAPKPQRPSSGDFTFKPVGSQLPASRTVSRPNEQLTKPSSMVQQPPAPQAPSYRPAMHNAGQQQQQQQQQLQQVMQGFPSSRPSNQFIQPQTPVPPPSPGSAVHFSGNQSPMRPPLRPAFLNRNPAPPTSPVPQMGPPRGFMQAPQISNFPGPLPPRMANAPQLQQNQSTQIRPGNIFVPNQQYSNNLSFSGKPASSPGGNQVYDPFSPTSISTAPQQVNNSAKIGKQENDAEYDDLMASMGMR